MGFMIGNYWGNIHLDTILNDSVGTFDAIDLS